jgi:hypothetical protein
MSWRNTPPKRSNYESDEEYDEAVDFYHDALEAYYEDKRSK